MKLTEELIRELPVSILVDLINEADNDLSNDDKASIAGIPAPSRNDARGDEQYAFDDYCNKWWDAKTISQKQETYKEWADEMPWWERED